MSELSILQAFVAAGMTAVGACAMGGNIQAEGVWRGNNAQDAYEKLRGFTDESYTAAVDNGSYTRDNFRRDDVGYGLCQWTYQPRKAKLYDFAKSRGTSISDEEMQADFAIWELQNDYLGLWRYLCQTQDLAGATGRICTEYERPAVNNIAERARYAHELYMWYGDKLSNLSAPITSLSYAQSALEGIKDVGCVGEQGVCGLTTQCRGKFMPVIKRGNASPEARYLADKLAALGYDVLWDGLWACVVDYQQKMGLTVDGVCGEQTWKELLNESYE